MKTFNLAIVGLGNIGTEVYKSLNKNKDIIKKKTGFKLNIIKVSAKNYKKRRYKIIKKQMGKKILFHLPKNKNIDIIIELVGGNKGIAKKLVFQVFKK